MYILGTAIIVGKSNGVSAYIKSPYTFVISFIYELWKIKYKFSLLYILILEGIKIPPLA